MALTRSGDIFFGVVFGVGSGVEDLEEDFFSEKTSSNPSESSSVSEDEDEDEEDSSTWFFAMDLERLSLALTKASLRFSISSIETFLPRSLSEARSNRGGR